MPIGKHFCFFAVAGLVGGFFTGIYLLDSYPVEIRQQLMDEIGKMALCDIPVDIFLGLVTSAQAMGYGLVLGAIGILVGKKCGLWKDERVLERKPLLWGGIIALIGGVAIIVPDLLFFGKYAQPILDSYAMKPTVPYMLAAVVYGGVIEEVMLRLFAMSMIAFIVWKVFDKKSEKPSVAVLVAANIVSSLLFAAGHLPATAALMGLTPMTENTACAMPCYPMPAAM